MSYLQVPAIHSPIPHTEIPQPGPSHQSTPRTTIKDLGNTVLYNPLPSQTGVGGPAGMAGVGLGSWRAVVPVIPGAW